MCTLLARSLAPSRPLRCSRASGCLTGTSLAVSISSILLPPTRPRPKLAHHFVQQAQPTRKQTASQTRSQTGTHYNQPETAIALLIGPSSVSGSARPFSTQSSAMFAPKCSLRLEKWKGKGKIIGFASTKPDNTVKVRQRFQILNLLNLSISSPLSFWSKFLDSLFAIF